MGKYYHTGQAGSCLLTVCEDEDKIVQIVFGEYVPEGARRELTPMLERAFLQLQEYFSGKREVFDLPLSPEGTDFQKKVWKALVTIPYGETRSYQDIAAQVGNEKASRAVGMANHCNPIAIVVPCHRVVGKNGKLVGYAGGLEVKESLLKLEKTDWISSPGSKRCKR